MTPPGKFIVTTATIQCRMCPTIITGITADGWTVYVRYRSGHFSVRMDARTPPPHGGAAGKWIMEKQLDPDGIEGFISYEELRELTADIIEWPEETTPSPPEDDGGASLDNL